MHARNHLTIAAAAFTALALLAVPASAVSQESAGDLTGTISGVTSIDSEGLTSGMRVSARPFAGSAEVASDVSDDRGRFTLTVPPGEYLVTLHTSEFRFPSGGGLSRFDHYSQGPAKLSTDRIEEAQPVSVTADETVPDIQLWAWPALGFEGHLHAREASLLSGLVVTAYETDGSVAATHTVRSRDIEHGQARYAFGGLRQGTYRIGVRKGGLVDESRGATMRVIVDTGNSQLAPDIQVRPYTANTSRPRISATPRVGAPLTASVGRWTRTSGVTWRYRWYLNGKPIKAATRARYTPTAGTLGKRLRVRVWAVHRGQVVDRATSAATRKVARGRIQVVRRPSLTVGGAPVVGRKVGRELGYWKPSGLTWRQQWLRNGRAIPGQRGRTYRLRASDRGKRISLRVTASRKGFHTTVRRTDSVLVR